MGLVAWSLNGSVAGVELVYIETSRRLFLFYATVATKSRNLCKFVLFWLQFQVTLIVIFIPLITVFYPFDLYCFQLNCRSNKLK